MPPTVVLIRHAQALHNATKDYSLHDPLLTEQGASQCGPLRDALRTRFSPFVASDVAIISSPMRRTLQTTLLSLDWLIEQGVKVEAHADWQENSSKPCDTGSPVSSLAPLFPQVDFSTTHELYPDKTSPRAHRFSETRSAVIARGARCLDALYDRPERLIFVVSHSGFMRVGVVGRPFANADFRIFRFAGEQPGQGGRKAVVQDEGTFNGGLGLSEEREVELGEGLKEES